MMTLRLKLVVLAAGQAAAGWVLTAQLLFDGDETVVNAPAPSMASLAHFSFVV
jgi:hypothetical protein